VGGQENEQAHWLMTGVEQSYTQYKNMSKEAWLTHRECYLLVHIINHHEKLKGCEQEPPLGFLAIFESVKK